MMTFVVRTNPDFLEKPLFCEAKAKTFRSIWVDIRPKGGYPAAVQDKGNR